MKVKQLLSHFWYGASEVELIKVCYGSKLVGTITREELAKHDYRGFDNESVNSFKIKEQRMWIYLKV